MRGLFACVCLVCLSVISVFIVGCGPNVAINDQVSIEPSAEYPMSDECSADSDCVKGGCSRTVCHPKSSEPMATTCEWKEEYGCYEKADCVCLAGKCGWQGGDEFDSCIMSVSEKVRTV